MPIIDEPYKDRLVSDLTFLKRKGLVEKVWHDRHIDGGDDWRAAIKDALNDCNLALLLVSHAFLTSDFIQSHELGQLLHRSKTDGIRVVPVILKDCLWELEVFEGLQAWPKNGKPIVTFNEENGDRDWAWTDISRKIAAWAVQAVNSPSSTALPHPNAGNPPSPPAPSRDTVSAANPYNPWNKAVTPRFFGRDDLLRRLGMALDERRSVSLVGDWRIGKTSVLRTWQQMAEVRGRTVRFVSGQGPAAVSCAAFVKAVCDREAAESANFDAAADAAADVLARWVQEISPAALPPLILIDEADALLPRLPARFFERLRGMLGTVCLVIATRREIDQIYRDTGRTSPFANQLEMQRLGLLETAAAEQIIALGAEMLTAEDRELMHCQAGRHPYYLTLLGRQLWDARRNNTDIQEALERFEDEAHARLRELWNVLSERDQKALLGLLHGQMPDSNSLKRRGLMDGDQFFGEVLETWLKNPQ